MIEIQGQLAMEIQGLDCQLHECALDDTNFILQHPNTCTSASHKTWSCTFVFFGGGDVLNHHDSPLVQSCNDTYMETKQNVIDFNMLYPHRSPLQVHLFPCDYSLMMTNVIINR